MAKRDRWAEGWTKANAYNATGAHSGSTAPKGPWCDASEPRLFKRPELLVMGGAERGDETTPSDDMLGSMGVDRDQVAGLAHGPSSQCWVAIRPRNARSA